jgi:hypothetical protein
VSEHAETVEEARARRLAKSDAMRAERERMRGDPDHVHQFDPYIACGSGGYSVTGTVCKCGQEGPR